jgi:hypothetical protein
VCLFSGARACRRLAIGVAIAEDFAILEEGIVVAGNAVMVCEVEVMDEDALLLLAIAAQGP